MPKIDPYQNFETRMEDTTLVIRIETDPEKVDARPSSSGKTLTVSTTGGYRWGVEGLDGVGLNLTLSLRR